MKTVNFLIQLTVQNLLSQSIRLSNYTKAHYYMLQEENIKHVAGLPKYVYSALFSIKFAIYHIISG